jgi:hypothetical protein
MERVIWIKQEKVIIGSNILNKQSRKAEKRLIPQLRDWEEGYQHFALKCVLARDETWSWVSEWGTIHGTRENSIQLRSCVVTRIENTTMTYS